MPLLSTHIFKKICSFLRFSIYLHRCVEILVFLLFLQQKDPLSLLTTFAASSPKGTPYGTAGNFFATAKAVPLRDDFPRSGGRCRVATKGGVWLDAKRQDGRGTHTKSTASLCGKRCFFQPFSARMWKTRCSFSSSYWWGP